MTAITYRGYTIEPCIAEARGMWTFVHDEYDGPEDGRAGFAKTPDACKVEIDLIEGDCAEAEPTPGPWRIEGSIRWPDGTTGKLISAGVNEHGDGPKDYIARISGASAEDLRLMLAAPDMLAALEHCAKTLRTGQPQIVGDDTVYPLDGAMVGNALNMIRAAIAKATA